MLNGLRAAGKSRRENRIFETGNNWDGNVKIKKN